MIIISQNRKNLFNFDKVKEIWIDDAETEDCSYEIYADGETLGYYKTEERAIQVMRELRRCITGIFKEYEMPKE